MAKLTISYNISSRRRSLQWMRFVHSDWCKKDFAVTFKKIRIVLVHAFVGWARCAATVGFGPTNGGFTGPGGGNCDPSAPLTFALQCR